MTDDRMPYGRWCMEADAADTQREDLVPLAELPGLASGRATLSRALELLQEAPAGPPHWTRPARRSGPPWNRCPRPAVTSTVTSTGGGRGTPRCAR